jgi:hypothetical protein
VQAPFNQMGICHGSFHGYNLGYFEYQNK